MFSCVTKKQTVYDWDATDVDMSRVHGCANFIKVIFVIDKRAHIKPR